ncbi:MAG: DEAD/DEAH box helicase [Maricaulaceae bacterium]
MSDKTKDIEEIPADAPVDVSFAELGLHDKILKALGDMGYEKPTPIQSRSIPAAMQGRDVLGIAQTGTGKTGAFTLPVMHNLANGRARARMPRCLIVCPTRELAAQVAENVELYGKYLKLEMALLIGGVSFAEQDRKLMKGVDILIATPGRLLDQFDRGKILLNGVQTLVVDEADRMLDMGFIPDIEKIFKLTPFTRQVLFFSATFAPEIKRLVDQFLHQPETVQIARQNKTADTVTQRIIKMPTNDSKQKRTALRWVIDNSPDMKNGIVFCNRKKDVDIVAKSLTVHGHSAAPIHGDLAQSLRMETLKKFKSGEVKILCASDVAARGLDIPDVSHVLNYDVPSHAEDYVHRIGRTGRAGRKGDTVMFVAPRDSKYYDAILSLISLKSIEEMEVPGLEGFPTERSRSRRDDKRSKGRSSKSKSDSRRKPRSEQPRSDQAGSKTENTQSSDKKPSKAKSSRKPADKSSEKPRRNRDKDQDSQDRSKSHDRKSSSNTARKSYHNLPKNTEKGFGESMPAFFNNSL